MRKYTTLDNVYLAWCRDGRYYIIGDRFIRRFDEFIDILNKEGYYIW